MADQGPASNTPELQVGANTTAAVFLEVHTQNNVSTPLATGVPGGLAGPATGLNNLGPADFGSVTDVGAYGTHPDGSAVTPLYFQTFPVANPAGGASAMTLFSFKNPA